MQLIKLSFLLFKSPESKTQVTYLSINLLVKKIPFSMIDYANNGDISYLTDGGNIKF